MKQIFSNMIILFGVIFLSACGQTADNSGHILYTAKIDEYASALTCGKDKFFDKYNEDCSSINALMVGYTYDGGSISYAYHDINKDGTDELLFAQTTPYDHIEIIDIYTLKDDTLIKIFENCTFGERTHLYILPDGTLVTDGSENAFRSVSDLYSLDSTGNLITVDGYYYSDTADSNDNSVFESNEHTKLTSEIYQIKIQDLQNSSITSKLNWINITKTKDSVN